MQTCHALFFRMNQWTPKEYDQFDLPEASLCYWNGCFKFTMHPWRLCQGWWLKKNLLSKSSLHILESAQHFNFRTLGGGHKSSKQPPKSRDKVAIKFGHPPLKIYWIRSDSEEIIRNLKKCYANICTESIQAPPLILASNPFCAPFTSDTTVDAASNGTDEWWRKMRTFPSAFFL